LLFVLEHAVHTLLAINIKKKKKLITTNYNPMRYVFQIFQKLHPIPLLTKTDTDYRTMCYVVEKAKPARIESYFNKRP
jgi:hypothetical protein